MEQKKQLYLFDFDGTLTHVDTLFDFLKHSQPNYQKGFILHLPLFVWALLGLIPKWTVKEKFVAYFLKGKNRKEIQKMSHDYFQKRHQNLFRENAIDFIQKLPSNADKYLVSASLDIWLEPFAEFLDLKLISTKGQFENDIYTGKFASPNCNYEEKAQRIQKEIPLSDFQKITAFGDTKGDEAMYELADEFHHQYFNK